MRERISAYVGVDVGTASTKAVLVGDDGGVLKAAVRRHRVGAPTTGHFEVDAEAIWREVLDCLGELVHNTVGIEIRGLGVSAMGPCVVLTDAVGDVVAPAILYGVDSRNTLINSDLTASLGGEQIVATSGNALTSQSAGSKLAWVRREWPDAWGRARHFHSLASFLTHRLTGEYVMDHHTASQFDPLYDLARSEWWPDGLEAVMGGEPLVLPSLAWSEEIIGATLQHDAGLPPGVPVTAGTIDAWAEAISVGADRDGELMLMYGSTMFLIANTTQLVKREGLWSTRAARRAAFSLAGGTATAGAITQWWSDIFDEPDFELLHDEAAESTPGSRGLITLPYFAGERTPFFDPDARGLVVGLTTHHRRGDLYRSALEASAMAVRHNLELFGEALVGVERCAAVGGGVQGGLWPQVVADVTRLPQVVRKRALGASYGNTVLVADALGAQPDIDVWNPVDLEYAPDSSNGAVYDELYDHYLSLHQLARPTMHYLAHIQRKHDAQLSP